MAREHDIEACNLFLSCMTNDPAGIPLFADRLDVEDFPLRQGLVWQTMLKCMVDRIPATPHELEFRLGNTSHGFGDALEVVGQDYVLSLPNLMIEHGVRSSNQATLFCERIERSTERALLSDFKAEAEEALGKKALNFDEWWNDVVAHVMEKRQKRQGVGAKMLADYWGELEPALEAWLNGKPYMRVTTGLRKLDIALGGGLLKKELHIIAGRPGTTKTLLALTMSKKQAEQGFRVGWSSLEMPGEMLLLRLLCADAGLDWSRLMVGGYAASKANTQIILERARQKIGKLPIYVDDRSAVTTDDVHWQALRLSMTHGIDVWYVDFVQLLKDLGPDELNVAKKVFRRTKEMGKLLNIPTVAISQIRKRVDNTEDKLPIAADVPFSGDDVAGFILMPWDLYKYHSLGQISSDVVPGIYDAEGDRISCADSQVIYYVLAKARYAQETIIKMGYNREFGRLSDLGFKQKLEGEPF